MLSLIQTKLTLIHFGVLFNLECLATVTVTVYSASFNLPEIIDIETSEIIHSVPKHDVQVKK